MEQTALRPERKQALLDWAEVTDAWRVIPRCALLWFLVEASRGLSWYYSLDTRSAVDHLMGAALLGIAPVAYKFYVETGRKWTPF